MNNTEENSLKTFKENLSSLMMSLNDRIETLSEMLSFYNGGRAPSKKVDSINTLKFYRYKVKERLEELDNASQEYWERNRSIFQDEYIEAKQLLA